MLVAVGASIGLVAITSSSSDDFEDAGQTGVETRCAPNEFYDQELGGRGAKGVNQTYREIEADTIGCNPICGTWEYYDQGRKAAGSGGPQGNGGLFSTDAGCFAPCYWNYRIPGRNNPQYPSPIFVKSSNSSLRYYDDNRAPIIRQVRLGVNYRRSVTSDFGNPPRLWQHSDLGGTTQWGNKDGQHIISAKLEDAGGSRLASGSPLHPDQIAAGSSTVFKPNWHTGGQRGTQEPTDPGGTVRNGTTWEDENWEIRADLINKVCTIVNITLDDEVVCSSEWENCATPS